VGVSGEDGSCLSLKAALEANRAMFERGAPGGLFRRAVRGGGARAKPTIEATFDRKQAKGNFRATPITGATEGLENRPFDKKGAAGPACNEGGCYCWGLGGCISSSAINILFFFLNCEAG